MTSFAENSREAPTYIQEVAAKIHELEKKAQSHILLHHRLNQQIQSLQNEAQAHATEQVCPHCPNVSKLDTLDTVYLHDQIVIAMSCICQFPLAIPVFKEIVSPPFLTCAAFMKAQLNNILVKWTWGVVLQVISQKVAFMVIPFVFGFL